MRRTSRYLLLLAWSSALLISGCSGGASAYHVLTISDIHFNPFYDASLYPALAADDVSQWASIFQSSSMKTPSAFGADTNYPLLELTLAGMKQNLGTSPVILFTGDLLGHNIPEAFCVAYSQIPPPVPPATCPPLNPAGTLAMQQFMDKTFAFVAGQIRAAVGNTPVIYVVGNIDTYGVGYGPDTTFLGDNAGTVYTQFLNGGTDQPTFLGTFDTGGYYSAQLLGSKLLVIGLNTNSFFDQSPTHSDANAELAWLGTQLSAAQAAGQHAWILMHVPPGANSQGTAQAAATVGTPGYIDDETTSMMWDPTDQTMFIQTLEQYPGVVTLLLAGHTHMDEYRILPTGNALVQLPGISPVFGNNPAFKVLTIEQATLMATDFESFDYDLAKSPAQFTSLYRLSTTYGSLGSLDYSLQRLYPQLVGNEARRRTYAYYYGSGTAAVNQATNAPYNPINNADWPIFACTISKTAEQDYIDCVDNYP
jgi:sphingomyelin phosphodiesterase acid-like 3